MKAMTRQAFDRRRCSCVVGGRRRPAARTTRSSARKRAIKTQWAQVENQLQRRNDLIPNLVETTKGIAQQERDVFGQIAESRAKLAGAQTPRADDAGGQRAERGAGPAAGRRRELSAAAVERDVQPADGRARGHREPHRRRADALQRARAGVQHVAPAVPVEHHGRASSASRSIRCSTRRPKPSACRRVNFGRQAVLRHGGTRDADRRRAAARVRSRDDAPPARCSSACPRTSSTGSRTRSRCRSAQLAQHVATHPDVGQRDADASRRSTSAAADRRRRCRRRAELLALFDRNVADARAALVGKTDAELMAPWALKRERQDDLLDAEGARSGGRSCSAT